MPDKNSEKECLLKVIKNKDAKGEIAKFIHNYLKNSKEKINYNSERPDIIIDSDDEIIGIEHFQIDLLTKQKIPAENHIYSDKGGKQK